MRTSDEQPRLPFPAHAESRPPPEARRVRADRGGGGLRAELSFDPPALTLFPASSPSPHPVSAVTAWFSDDFLSPLLLLPGDEHLDGWMRAMGLRPGPLPVSATYREREGGRRYCFHLRGYHGPRILSGRRFREVCGTSPLLLPAIPRELRRAVHAPAGRRYLILDIASCFPVLLATVAQDEALLEAARNDLHREAGNVMAPHLPPTARRQLGKLFNNAVVGLISPVGWYQELRFRGFSTTVEQASQMHARWWAQFPDARRFRDEWIDLHRRAADQGLPLAIRYPDGRVFRFDAAAVRGTAKPRWSHIRDPEHRLQASIRSSFSAIWRGIEGVILDESLRRLHARRAGGLRLVLPIYDGVLLEVEDHDAEATAHDALSDFGAALDDVGVGARVKAKVARTWAGD